MKKKPSRPSASIRVSSVNVKASCGCINNIGGGIVFCQVHAAAFELLDACNAVDIYFKAMCEQWNANDGRVVSEAGTIIQGSPEIENLCDVAAYKVWSALKHATEKSNRL